MGYENVPDYSYLFHPIGGEWLDSPVVAEKEKYTEEHPQTEVSLGGMQMTLSYLSDPSRGIEGTVWEVIWEGEQSTSTAKPVLLATYDATSGDSL